jgi:hypothetical protein
MSRRGIQYLPYVGSFGRGRSNRVLSIGEGDIAITAKIDDGLRFAHKAMSVARGMVVGINDESDTIEVSELTVRITQAAWV